MVVIDVGVVTVVCVSVTHTEVTVVLVVMMNLYNGRLFVDGMRGVVKRLGI